MSLQGAAPVLHKASVVMHTSPPLMPLRSYWLHTLHARDIALTPTPRHITPRPQILFSRPRTILLHQYHHYPIGPHAHPPTTPSHSPHPHIYHLTHNHTPPHHAHTPHSSHSRPPSHTTTLHPTVHLFTPPPPPTYHQPHHTTLTTTFPLPHPYPYYP